MAAIMVKLITVANNPFGILHTFPEDFQERFVCESSGKKVEELGELTLTFPVAWCVFESTFPSSSLLPYFASFCRPFQCPLGVLLFYVVLLQWGVLEWRFQNDYNNIAK